jgi:PAS domain S-box-containing protein
MLPGGTTAARLRTLEHGVVVAIVGASVSVGSVGAIVVGFHRSTLLGAIVIIDVVAALSLGAALLSRQRQKADWAQFVAAIDVGAAPGAVSSLKAHAEAVRHKLGVDGAALLLAARGEPWTTVAVAGTVPTAFRPGTVMAESLPARRPARPSAWSAPRAGDPLGVEGTAYASCALVPVRDRTGQVVVWSARSARQTLWRFGALARAASESIERSRLDEAEHRSRLGAAHARQHLALLVATGAAMATAIDDWQPALAVLADAVVPEDADYFSVDVIAPDGRARRLAERNAGPGTPPAPEWVAVPRRTTVFPAFSGRLEGCDDVGTALRERHAGLGLSSWAAIPVPLRGGSTAVLCVGTLEPRRGLRPSDVATYEEVATRCAMAFERVSLYQEAASKERRLRTLIDASPLAMIELTTTGTLRSWNPAATELFGWTAANGAQELEAPARETLLALRARLSAGERSVVDRATLDRSNGDEPMRLSIAASLVPGPGGGDDDLLCILTDITQQERMELALQARERMEALGRLAGGIAHDFNNLLTVIVGYSELLANGLGAGHAMYDDVDAIREAGRRAAAFTEQLLTISRRRVSEGAAIEFDDTVRKLEPVLRRLVGEDVTFVVEYEAGAGWINVDQSQFEQVLLNLVVNARDAMPEGGMLTITVASTRGEDGALWSVLSVADTGVGMDAATVERCFEPFFTTKGLAKGTGLGLATVYSVVDQAGGTVTIETAPGMGTRMRVMFPTVVAEAALAEPSAPGAGPVAEEALVLLVEDDDMVRAFAREVLTRAGYAVLEASDGTEAIALGRVLEPPCALVTDVVMPGMSGPEIAAHLPGVPALYISGYVEDERRGSLLAATPVNRFLPKPFTGDDLLAAVRELVALSQGSKR